MHLVLTDEVQHILFRQLLTLVLVQPVGQTYPLILASLQTTILLNHGQPLLGSTFLLLDTFYDLQGIADEYGCLNLLLLDFVGIDLFHLSQSGGIIIFPAIQSFIDRTYNFCQRFTVCLTECNFRIECFYYMGIPVVGNAIVVAP